MKERPILFSAPMVRAILEDRKTQTRRVVKPQSLVAHVGGDIVRRSPYGVPGDRLWVRETWCDTDEDHDKPWTMYKASSEMRAPDGSFHGCLYQGPWRPSIFMPRWVSRITLEVTGVRVERLQSISEGDARAEGVHPYGDEYRCLWDSLNAKRGYGWDLNPWCWVIEFKRVVA